MSLEYFIRNVSSRDFFRKNMFSVALSDGPGNHISSTFDNILSPLYTDSWLDKSMGALGLNNNLVLNAATDITSKAVTAWGNKGGRNFLTAMNSSIVQSVLGEFAVGQIATNFFSSIDVLNYDVVGVTLPEASFAADSVLNDTGGRNIKLGMFSEGQLSITFRQTVEGKMYQVFQDWMRLIHNPDTGLRAFQDDICCNISVNEHERSGAPVAIHQFNGAIPISVEGMSYSYDNNNELQTFTVIFKFTRYTTGYLGKENSKHWLEAFAGSIAGKAASYFSTSQSEKLGSNVIGNVLGAGLSGSGRNKVNGIASGLTSGLMGSAKSAAKSITKGFF